MICGIAANENEAAKIVYDWFLLDSKICYGNVWLLLLLGTSYATVSVTLSVVGTDKFVLPMVDWLTSVPPNPSQNELFAIQIHYASVMAVELLNNNTFPDILPHTTIELDIKEDRASPARAIEAVVEFAEQGHTLIVGFPISAIAVPAASASTVYGLAQVSGVSSTSTLSDKQKFPYFSRTNVATDSYGDAMKESIVFYQSIQDAGWNNLAVISTISEFTLTFATHLINIANPEITIASYQQFLPEQEDLTIEFNEIKKSGARVISGLVFGDWQEFIEKAEAAGLVGEQFVWYVTGTVVAFNFIEPSPETRGTLGVTFHQPDSVEKQKLLDYWNNADPEIYPFAGLDYPPTPLIYRRFDIIIAVAKTIDLLEQQGLLDGKYVSPELWSSTLRGLSFTGASGIVEFYENGDRIGEYSVLYYSPENGWQQTALYSRDTGYQLIQDVVWGTNTTDIPDLDIQEPFYYWSCNDKERKFDETGKSVELHSPGASSFDDIDSDYHCDRFIDCHNMSDESVDCTENYFYVFLAFGIVTVLLIILCVFLIVFVVVFGIVLKYRRVRPASPISLLIILLSMIAGFASVFAWFGKPHPVSCIFQAWLLGLSTVSMIAALSTKNFRIWRIFKFPTKKVRITDLELFMLWIIIIIPAVIILVLWSIISTPTAALEERNGADHYVCTTGGFSGAPGGLVFFFIFVAYSTIVLIIGACMSLAVRNVPSQFNETQLLTISIYNLGFLAVVIIPVFLAVNPFNPFVAWILRTCAILYAFTATLVLQFVPMLFGIIVIDKGKNVRVFKTKLSPAIPFSSSSDSNMPPNSRTANESM